PARTGMPWWGCGTLDRDSGRRPVGRRSRNACARPQAARKDRRPLIDRRRRIVAVRCRRALEERHDACIPASPASLYQTAGARDSRATNPRGRGMGAGVAEREPTGGRRSGGGSAAVLFADLQRAGLAALVAAGAAGWLGRPTRSLRG